VYMQGMRYIWTGWILFATLLTMLRYHAIV